MKLAVGTVLLVTAFALTASQIRRYRSRPNEAISEDVIDVIFGFLPNVTFILVLLFAGTALIYAHFSGS